VYRAAPPQHTMSELAASIACWYAFWFACYKLSHVANGILFETYGALKPATQAYWCASSVSSLHAIVIVYLSFTAGVELEVWTRPDVFFATSARSGLTNRVFVGYLLCDLSCSLYYNAAWSGWVENLVHHAAGIWCWSTLERDQFGHIFLLTALLAEGTTPFVNNRWFLAQSGMKDGRLYFYNGLLMTGLWFLLRVVLFAWLGTRLVAMRADLAKITAYQSVVLYVNYAIGYALQLFWFRKILKGALKALRGGSTKEAAKAA